MTKAKTLFRRVYDSILAGRQHQAQLYIAQYVKAHPELLVRRDGAFTNR